MTHPGFSNPFQGLLPGGANQLGLSSLLGQPALEPAIQGEQPNASPFPDLVNASPSTIQAQMALLGVQDAPQFAKIAAAQGPPPTASQVPIPNLGQPQTDMRINPNRGSPTPGPGPGQAEAEAAKRDAETLKMLQALAAIKPPQSTPAPAIKFPSPASLPSGRGGPDSQFMAQILQLLQGSANTNVPSLGQLIGR